MSQSQFNFYKSFPTGFTCLDENKRPMLCFFTMNTIWSNHYPCELDYDERRFNSSEQMYMWLRACHFKDFVAAETFLSLKNAMDVKKKSLEPDVVKGFNRLEWSNVKMEKMALCLLVKFGQIRSLNKALEDSIGLLVETSPKDNFWGSACTVFNICRQPTWRGQKFLGSMLTQLRKMLKSDWAIAIQDGTVLAQMMTLEACAYELV